MGSDGGILGIGTPELVRKRDREAEREKRNKKTKNRAPQTRLFKRSIFFSTFTNN